MQIENCKLKIAEARSREPKVCNLQFAIRNLQLLFLSVGILALGIWLGTRPTHANERAVFSIEQAKDRGGRGGFPHDQKDHLKVVCADCHLSAKEKPARSDQPMAKDFPHTACIRCHNFAAEFFKAAMGQPSRFCGACHEPRRISRADKALRPGMFPSPRISDFDDAFSHRAHRKTLPADFRIAPIGNPPYGAQFNPGASPRCTDCHAQIKQTENRHRGESDNNDSVVRALQSQSIEFRTGNGHDTCFVCHGGAAESRRVSAEVFPYSNDCNVCHELNPLKNSVRTHSLFGSVRGFRHDDHDLDIRPKKRSDFPLPAAPDRLCSECHKPIEQIEKLNVISLPEAGYCNSCHIDKKPGLPGRLTGEVLNKLKGN